MKTHAHVIVISFLLVVFSSCHAEEQKTEWGEWATKNNNGVYGSGVVGDDENLLHQLDKSSLLDYEPRLEDSFPPEFPGDGATATDPIDSSNPINDSELDLMDEK